MKNYMIILAVMLLSLSAPAQALDKAAYEKVARASINTVLSDDKIDANALIDNQKKLIDMAIKACDDYASKHPKDAKLLKLVVDNASTMQGLSLEQIEEQWHDYGLPNSKGIDVDAYEHFAPVISLMDTVVHPATAVIVLKIIKRW